MLHMPILLDAIETRFNPQVATTCIQSAKRAAAMYTKLDGLARLSCTCSALLSVYPYLFTFRADEENADFWLELLYLP
jgi:hypothetical protein